LTVGLALGWFLLAGSLALGHDTEEQLLQRIQTEQNPVKKTKYEIKLAGLKLAQVHDAYSQGHPDEGAKFLAAFVDSVKFSLKSLQDSGRKAPKQPEGFRELEISLREEIRVLQDLQPSVSYLDRPPLENAVHELEEMRSEVIKALFPGGTPRTIKGSPPPQAVTDPAPPAETR